MLKYFISILFLTLTFVASAQETEPEPEEDRTVTIVDSAHQFRLGFDVSRLLFNSMQKKLEKRTVYEVQLDYYWRRDLYWVAEAGFGNAALTYPDLAYSSKNTFVRLGFDKSILPRLKQNDWDMALIGLRYGLGFIERGQAVYTITDNLWGGFVTNTVAPENVTAHWIEITGGVRVELYKGAFIGWNVRGKFLLNPKKFTELPPYNIAGYGKGEKNSIFDFNVYLSYAIRWDRKHIPPVKK